MPRFTLALLCLIAAVPVAAQEVIRLEAPDFKGAAVSKVPAKAAVSLKLLSAKPNKITDVEAWFTRHSLVLNQVDDVSTSLPSEVAGEPLLKTIRSGGRYLGLYGKNYASERYVAAVNADGEVEYVFDFANYRKAPRNVHTAIDYVTQELRWAEQQGDVLYVSHGHLTYAKSSYGMNAYISAIDVKSGKPLWHSVPLVANAHNFTILGDRYIVTGYGFTAEPDYLYILDIKDGSVVNRVSVKSSPEYVIAYDGKLYVRTYNTDYLFKIAGKM